jgi:uncharacterized C2H2 Zn-finger protein
VAWAGAIRNQSRDGSLDLACAACIQHHKVYAENVCRRLHLSGFGRGKTRVGRVDKESDRPFCRLELMQQFEALCGRCSLLLGYAREVASAAAGGEDEQGRGFFEYHKPSSYFGQYGDERVTEVGRYLDAVLEAVLRMLQSDARELHRTVGFLRRNGHPTNYSIPRPTHRQRY